MHLLWRRQLELLSRLVARLEAAKSQRVRLVDRLTELWSCIGALHAAAIAGDADMPGRAERARSLCEAVEREASGMVGGGIPSPLPFESPIRRSSQ